MSADKVEDKEKTPENFWKDYQKLCKDYDFQIVVTPAWKVSQDTGVWGTVLQVSLGKLPKE